MIKEVKITRPTRLEDLQQPIAFIPLNSKDQLIEIDFGFAKKPVYKQEKLCYFLPEQVYYQKLILVDGKGNAIKDDARTMVLTGTICDVEMIVFETDIYPAIPASVLGDQSIQLPFYPEINTEIIIRAKENTNAFYHFSCAKIMYRSGAASYLQLRHLGSYYYPGMVGLIRKWHPEPIEVLANIPDL